MNGKQKVQILGVRKRDAGTWAQAVHVNLPAAYGMGLAGVKSRAAGIIMMQRHVMQILTAPGMSKVISVVKSDPGNLKQKLHVNLLDMSGKVADGVITQKAAGTRTLLQNVLQ